MSVWGFVLRYVPLISFPFEAREREEREKRERERGGGGGSGFLPPPALTMEI